MSKQGESSSLYRHSDRHGGTNGQNSGASRRPIVGASYSPNSRVPGGYGGDSSHGRQHRESFEDWEDLEAGGSNRPRTWFGSSASSPYPIEVDWYQAPPVMYNLKLKMKVMSNHESRQLLPLTERPDLTASRGADSTSMAPLNGLYRRVSVTNPIKISGADFNRIKDSHLATRIDFCKFEGGTLLIALLASSHKRTSKSFIRYFSIDLDTVHLLPRVTRLQPGPIIPPKDAVNSLLPASSSLTSGKSTSGTQSTSKPSYSDTHSDSFLKSIIGDDYVSSSRSSFTWQDAGHVPTSSPTTLESSTQNGDYSYARRPKEPELTEAQLLSASVISKQTVVVDGTGMSRGRTNYDDREIMGDTASGHAVPPRRQHKPSTDLPTKATTDASSANSTSTSPSISPKDLSLQEAKQKKPEATDSGTESQPAPGSTISADSQQNDLALSYAVTHLPNGTSGHEDSTLTEDQNDASSQHSNTTSTMSTATPTSVGASGFHLNLAPGDSVHGATLSTSTTPTGSETPAPSTPTSTSSSYSIAATSTRDPSEGVEYMAKDIEQSFLPTEATCLSINRALSTWDHFEMVIGFGGGQILRYDPKIPKSQVGKEKEKGQPSYKVHNDTARMITGSVRRLSWINHNEFMAAFSDGFLYIFHLHYDDDPDFARPEKDPRRKRLPHSQASTTTPISTPSSSNGSKSSISSPASTGLNASSDQVHSAAQFASNANPSSVTDMSPPTQHTTPTSSSSKTPLSVSTSSPSSASPKTPAGKPKKEPKPAAIIDNIPIPQDGWISETMWRRVHKNGSKPMNPVGLWSICPGSIITDFAVSSDLKSLATTSKDGILRIFSMATFELLTAFKSYFGGFTCLAWSPDDAYIVTGGEDDLVSLWSVAEKALVARGKGHTSWVSKVTFDPHRCSSKAYYRFASVGQDCQLAIWEFSSDTLVPPKVTAQSRRRMSLSRSDSSPAHTLSSSASNSSSIYASPISYHAPQVHVIPPVPRDQCFGLEPIAMQKVTTSPLSEVQFLGADLLLVGGWAGQVAYFVLEPKKSGHGSALSSHFEMSRFAELLAALPKTPTTYDREHHESENTHMSSIPPASASVSADPTLLSTFPTAVPSKTHGDSADIYSPSEASLEALTQPPSASKPIPASSPSPIRSPLGNGVDMPNPEPRAQEPHHG